jgi:hypothetical protein
LKIEYIAYIHIVWGFDRDVDHVDHGGHGGDGLQSTCVEGAQEKGREIREDR